MSLNKHFFEIDLHLLANFVLNIRKKLLLEIFFLFEPKLLPFFVS